MKTIKLSDRQYKHMYKLISENLLNLGGAMGLQHTTTNWEKYFKNVLAAKEYAEKDYRKSCKEKIKWSKGGGVITSGDLLFVMYDIEKVKVED
jgi:hypothetical protein